MGTLGKTWKCKKFKKQPPRRTAMQECHGKFDAHCSRIYKQDTAQGYSRILQRFVDMFPSFTRPEQFDIIATEDYRIERQRQGCGDFMLNRELRLLRDFWQWMVTNNYTHRNIFAHVKFLQAFPKEKRRLTHEEHSRLVAEMYEPWLRVFYGELIKGSTLKNAATWAGVSESTARRGWKDSADRAGLSWVKPSFVSRLTLDLSRERLAAEICNDHQVQDAA